MDVKTARMSAMAENGTVEEGGTKSFEFQAHLYKPAPVLNQRLSNRSITRRYHSTWQYIRRWHRTSLEHSWGAALSYAGYCGCMVLIQNLNCNDVNQENRCNLLSEDVSMAFEIVFALWMTFTAFLFQSYISAAIGRFELTLSYVRGSYLCRLQRRTQTEVWHA